MYTSQVARNIEIVCMVFNYGRTIEKNKNY